MQYASAYYLNYRIFGSIYPFTISHWFLHLQWHQFGRILIYQILLHKRFGHILFCLTPKESRTILTLPKNGIEKCYPTATFSNDRNFLSMHCLGFLRIMLSNNNKHSQTDKISLSKYLYRFLRPLDTKKKCYATNILKLRKSPYLSICIDFLGH